MKIYFTLKYVGKLRLTTENKGKIYPEFNGFIQL